MKTKLIYEELLEVAKQAGISVRKELLTKSRGGFCLLNDDKLIILHKLLPLEAHTTILARCIADLKIEQDIFLTPATRQYIENEANRNIEKPIEFIVGDEN